MFFQCLNDRRHGGSFLPYGNINTFYPLAFLVNNRIYRNRRLTCLPVADDQLSLSPSDRNHGVDRLNARLQRRINPFSRNNAGCDSFYFTVFICLYRSFPVNRLTKSVYNAAQHRIPYRNLYHTARSLYGIAFIDILLAAQKNRANIVLFQIQHHTVYFAGELKQLSLHGIFKAMYAGDTVCNLDNRTHIGYFQFGGISLNLILYDRTNFFRS